MLKFSEKNIFFNVIAVGMLDIYIISSLTNRNYTSINHKRTQMVKNIIGNIDL